MLNISRREVTLLLFCITVFTFFYNYAQPSPRVALDEQKSLDSSSSNRVNTANIAASKLLGVEDALRDDGRRAKEFTDELEITILGDWEPEHRPVFDLGVAGTTAGENKLRWDGVSSLPRTNLIAHVSGLTILENVYLYKGVLYIVADDSTIFPSPVTITSSSGASGSPFSTPQEVRIISPSEAEIMGNWAMRMRGSSWIFPGSKLFGESHSLLSLYRAYSTLSEGKDAPTPPDRVFFIHTKGVDWANIGFDTRLARLLFPTLNPFFGEDWKDFADLLVPFYFDRIVIADHASAFWKSPETLLSPAKSLSLGTDASLKSAMQLTPADERLSMSRAFMLPALPDWFSTLRAGLLQPFGVTDVQRARAITYVSTQRRVHGPRLRQTDHAQLVAELQRLGSANDWEVNVVELADRPEDETPWRVQMRAALQSSVMLSVHGDFLTYSVFMKPTLPTPTVMEFFPSKVFTNNNEFIARAMGMDYITWQDTRKFTPPSLPPITDVPEDGMQVIKIDVPGVIRTIKEQMKRR